MKHKKSCFPDAPLCQAAKSFVCDNCGKIFARKQNLQNHETVCFKSIDSSLVNSNNFNASVENITQEMCSSHMILPLMFFLALCLEAFLMTVIAYLVILQQTTPLQFQHH